MAIKLKKLAPQARGLLTEEFRRGDVEQDFTEFELEFSRELDCEPLVEIIDEAMRRFNTSGAENAREEERLRTSSDEWLGPRVHATLRLRRSEAAEAGLWTWLAAVAVPHYVRWRWTNVPLTRFVGDPTNQAIARLWWVAELTRNGSEYLPEAFKNQDIPNTWLRFDLFHNPAAAVAAVRFLAVLREGQPATGREANKLGKAFNHSLTTTALDALVPAKPPDVNAMDEWTAEIPDHTLMLKNLPTGPEEDPVEQTQLDSVTEILASLWAEIAPPRPANGTGEESESD